MLLTQWCISLTWLSLMQTISGHLVQPHSSAAVEAFGNFVDAGVVRCKVKHLLVFVRALTEKCVEMLVSVISKLSVLPRVILAFGSEFFGCWIVL